MIIGRYSVLQKAIPQELNAGGSEERADITAVIRETKTRYHTVHNITHTHTHTQTHTFRKAEACCYLLHRETYILITRGFIP